MANVKWIKIVTNIFDNRKIKQIENLPEGDALLVVWFKLLCLAGITNDDGYIYLTDEIPFNSETLSVEFNKPLQTIKLALSTFEKFGMIEIVDDFIKLSNWEKYQNVEGMEKIREQTRKRVAKHREKKALEQSNNSNVTVTLRNATDIEEDIDIDKELDIDIFIVKWNSLDKNIPRLQSINAGTNRYKMLKARLNEYGKDKVLKAIELIDDSRFLKGYVTDFVITFDWFVKPNNFVKVLEGNYQGKKSNDQKQSKDNYTKEYVAKKLKDDDYAPR